MHFVDRHREKIRQSPMSSRLLWACLLLVVLLVLTFGAALFLFASLHNTKKDICRRASSLSTSALMSSDRFTPMTASCSK